MICPKCGKQIEDLKCRNCGLEVMKEAVCLIGSDAANQMHILNSWVISASKKEKTDEEPSRLSAEERAKYYALGAKLFREAYEGSSGDVVSREKPERLSEKDFLPGESSAENKDNKETDNGDNNSGPVDPPDPNDRKKKILYVALAITIIALCGIGWLILGRGNTSTSAGKETEAAWGPQDRATYTMESPAAEPTFNSITDNPTMGDERNFVRIGEINPDVTDLTDSVVLKKGKQYLVYIYIHNNASATYNDSAHDHKGVAWQTRLSTSFPDTVNAEETGVVKATITAENSNPLSVWDTATVTTEEESVSLKYVSGSAKIYNDWDANNTILPSTLFSNEGALIGLNEFNGVIPGCEEYHSTVSYVLEAE